MPSPNHQSKPIIIIGGGLSGLATAAALRHITGLSNILILESRPISSFENKTSGGAAMSLGPNGLRALRHIGGDAFLQQLISLGSITTGHGNIIPPKSYDEQGYDITTSQNDDNNNNNDNHLTNLVGTAMVTPNTVQEETGLPMLMIQWSVLHRLLRNLIPKDWIMAGCCCGEDGIVGYELVEEDDGTEGGIRLIYKNDDNNVDDDDDKSLTTTDATCGAITARLIIAADGITSTFRPLVNTSRRRLTIGFERKVKRRDVKDGGMVSVKAVTHHSLVSKAGFRPKTTYSYFLNRSLACFVGPAGTLASYWSIGVADEIDELTGTRIPFLSSTTHDADDDVDNIDKTTAKTLLLSKLASPTNNNDPICHFFHDVVKNTNPHQLYIRRSREAKTVGPSFVSSDSKVVLVGDAAHGMNGAYGQSANFAFEDAATLAVNLKHFFDGRGEDGDCCSWKEALERYSDLRLGRCLEMMKRSKERAERAMRGEEGGGDVTSWINDWDLES